MSVWTLRAQAYWQQRSRREQQMLLLMMVVLGAALYYLLLWQPLQQHRSKLQRQLPQLAAELQQVREMAAQASALKPQAVITPLPAGQLKAMLQQQFSPLGNALQLSAEGEHAVRVKGELSFVDWAGLQGSLASQQIRVLSLAMRSGSADGRVSLDVLLAHADGI